MATLAPGQSAQDPPETNQAVPTASCPAEPGRPCDLGEPKRYPDRSGLVGSVSVLRCTQCGIGITDPPLPDVAFLYEERESQDFQPHTAGLARTIKDIAFRREARRLLKQVGKRPQRILDFGCGSGLFTRCLGDLLPEAVVVGSDFHPEPSEALKDRVYVPNDRLTSQQAKFDLILAMHVLEHDDNPALVLQRLKSFATEDCTFVFEVPNIDCVWAPFFGQAWDAWYLPFHRVHFSRTSLRATLERSGFAIVRQIDATIPSMGRSIANVLGTRNTLPLLLLGAILHPLQWIAELLSRRPSALRVIAQAHG